jgi:geranylgeranyl diphosphate synthase type I
MSESNTLVELVEQRLKNFCAERKEQLTAIEPELGQVIDYIQDLLIGGKRFRALFAYWSWVSCLNATDLVLTEEQKERSAMALVDICAALEMFHAAALVHDDLLDNSDTRRGAPAVHKKFELLHQSSNWAGSTSRFGQAGSVIAGDLMLGWSSELFDSGVKRAPSGEIAWSCRDEFAKMRVEVMAGQYLDVLEENAGPTRPSEEALGRANRVMLYKTAKYSIEAPLLLGAAFCGTSADTRRGLSAFAIPLGLAFQLRDDVLGVFGEPEVTGKPAGDDLREGKRTVLIALTRAALNSSTAKIFDELMMNRELTPEQIRLLQETIRGSGSLEKVEQMIEEYGNESLLALNQLTLDDFGKSQLEMLAKKVVNRSS